MVGGSNLREVFRLGCVRLVTAHAEYRRVELRRLHRGRIVGVLGLGSMAGLAIDVGMLAALFLVEHVGMAGLASFMACEVDRPRGDFRHGVPAVVPVLSKAFWHQKAAHDQEQQCAQGKNCRQSKKVPGIFESLHAGACGRSCTPESPPAECHPQLNTGDGGQTAVFRVTPWACGRSQMTVTRRFSVSGPYVLLFCDAGPIIGAEGRCGQSLDIEEIALRAVSPGAPSLGTHHAVALLMRRCRGFD